MRGLQFVIYTLSKRANIKRVRLTAHTLRHTFAMNFLQANPGKLSELAALLGHESLHTTSIYNQASQDPLAESVEKIEGNIL
jgi:site-specific recombinase XerD